MQGYPSVDKSILSFPANVEVKIFSKPLSANSNLWEGEINGKRGFIPSTLIREVKLLKKPKHEVDVPTSEVPKTDAKIQPDAVQSTYEVVDGTTIYNDVIETSQTTEAPERVTATPDLNVTDNPGSALGDSPSQESGKADISSTVSEVFSSFNRWIPGVGGEESSENYDDDDEDDEEEDDDDEEEEEEDDSQIEEDSEEILTEGKSDAKDLLQVVEASVSANQGEKEAPTTTVDNVKSETSNSDVAESDEKVENNEEGVAEILVNSEEIKDKELESQNIVAASVTLGKSEEIVDKATPASDNEIKEEKLELESLVNKISDSNDVSETVEVKDESSANSADQILPLQEDHVELHVIPTGDTKTNSETVLPTTEVVNESSVEETQSAVDEEIKKDVPQENTVEDVSNNLEDELKVEVAEDTVSNNLEEIESIANVSKDTTVDSSEEVSALPSVIEAATTQIPILESEDATDQPLLEDVITEKPLIDEKLTKDEPDIVTDNPVELKEVVQTEEVTAAPLEDSSGMMSNIYGSLFESTPAPEKQLEINEELGTAGEEIEAPTADVKNEEIEKEQTVEIEEENRDVLLSKQSEGKLLCFFCLFLRSCY